MDANRLVESLTPPQAAAVQHVEGPLLILAGPGSGKTRVVTHRIAYLCQHGVPGPNILALTFTNKAADEMRQRLERLAPQSGVWMGTFHRFCARLLRQHCQLVGLRENYTILDMRDTARLLKDVINAQDLELTHTPIDRVAAQISWAKSNLITPEQYVPRSGSPIGSIVQQVYAEYQSRLLESNAVDFDDLLLHVGTILRESDYLRAQLDERYQFIMVDEYQDTNMAQYGIVRALSVDHPNLAVTGDPDQSIYGWRGANIDNILGFERDYPQVHIVRLEDNFRSTPQILQAADLLISNNQHRKQKSLVPRLAAGKPVRLVSYVEGRAEAEDIAGQIAYQIHDGRPASDFAIFYRNNSLSRSLEHSFRALGIPYQVVKGQEFYQRKEIRDVIGYLHLINNPQNNVAFMRSVNMPPRGIGAKTQQRLAEYAAEQGISLVEAARQAGLIDTLSDRARLAVARFASLYDRLSIAGTESLGHIVSAVIEEAGFREHLSNAQAEEGVDRLENLNELIAAAAEFDEVNPDSNNMELFLEQASLTADADGWDEAAERVTMMTLHAAKGLEFPVVYIVAVEQGILPTERANEDSDLEEERRLLFVGITRAKEELQLSLSRKRFRNGRTRDSVVSEFIMELPREDMELHVQPDAHRLDDAAVIAEARDELAQWDASVDSWDGIDPLPDTSASDAIIRKNETAPERSPVKLPGALRTAAEMLQEHSPALPKLTEGAQVRDPDNGTGVVLSVEGNGKKRRAMVQFDESGLTKTIFLQYSRLELVDGSNAFESDRLDDAGDDDIPF